MVDEEKLHSPVHSTFEALIVQPPTVTITFFWRNFGLGSALALVVSDQSLSWSKPVVV